VKRKNSGHEENKHDEENKDDRERRKRRISRGKIIKRNRGTSKDVMRDTIVLKENSCSYYVYLQ
jgi:hypothetical protein